MFTSNNIEVNSDTLQTVDNIIRVASLVNLLDAQSSQIKLRISDLPKDPLSGEIMSDAVFGGYHSATQRSETACQNVMEDCIAYINNGEMAFSGHFASCQAVVVKFDNGDGLLIHVNVGCITGELLKKIELARERGCDLTKTIIAVGKNSNPQDYQNGVGISEWGKRTPGATQNLVKTIQEVTKSEKPISYFEIPYIKNSEHATDLPGIIASSLGVTDHTGKQLLDSSLRAVRFNARV